MWAELDAFTVGTLAVETQLALAPGSLVANAVAGVSFTGNVSTSSDSITSVSLGGQVAGSTLTGTGIATGTTVTGTGPGTVSISLFPTASGTGVALMTGGAALIYGSPFSAVIGNVALSYAPSNYPLAVPVQGELYWVYFIDALFVGGAVTAIATQNQADFLNKAGYFLIDSVVTPMVGSSGGTVYQPTTATVVGTRTVTNANGPCLGGSGSANVSATANAAVGLPKRLASSTCNWDGFTSFVLTATATLKVTALVSISTTGGGSGSGSATLSATVGGTTTDLISAATSSVASTTYTLSLASGTDISTVSVLADPSADATVSSGDTASCAIVVSSITIDL